MNLTIGSGDANSLFAGYKTKTFQDLLRKFAAEEKPYYNALSSPIDAFRIGAILEKNYLETLSDDYFFQFKSTCEEMNVFKSSIDFAKIQDGMLVDFDELKTIYFTEFIEIIEPNRENDDISFILKNSKLKHNYIQVQFQLMCSGLESANLVYLSVLNYNDEENISRVIQKNDYAKFRIFRDDKIIEKFKERGKIFQDIKDLIEL